MNNAVANKVYEKCSADYTSLMHYAMREDGQWFTRIQIRNAFGRTWSAWRVSMEPEWARDTGRKARLPKGVA